MPTLPAFTTRSRSIRRSYCTAATAVRHVAADHHDVHAELSYVGQYGVERRQIPVDVVQGGDSHHMI